MSLPCPVPVAPGTPLTCDDEGEPLPLEERTEKCAVDAFFAIGGAPVCDAHLRDFCAIAEWNFDEVLAELRQTSGAPDPPGCGTPWESRRRYPQSEVPEPPGERPDSERRGA